MPLGELIDEISQSTDDRIFRRGVDYQKRGRVLEWELVGDKQLAGRVKGSDFSASGNQLRNFVPIIYRTH